MPESKPNNWLCPICSLKELPYGQGCPLWEKDECPDAAHAHLTETTKGNPNVFMLGHRESYYDYSF